jgi:hypothetical protein
MSVAERCSAKSMRLFPYWKWPTQAQTVYWKRGFHPYQIRILILNPESSLEAIETAVPWPSRWGGLSRPFTSCELHLKMPDKSVEAFVQILRGRRRSSLP